MSRSLTRPLVAALPAALLAACCIGVPAAQASGSIGAVRWSSSAPACAMSGGRVTTLAVPAASAAMRSAWRGHYRSQFVREQASLIASSDGRTWTTVAQQPHADTAVSASLTALRTPGAFRNVASAHRGYLAYRVVQQLTWFSPKVRNRVEGSIRRTVARYRDGRGTQSQCTNAPAAVTGVRSAASTSAIALAWNRPTNPYVSGTVVRVAPGTTAPAVDTGMAGRSTTSGATVSAAPATTYTYSIWVVDRAGHYSSRVTGRVSTPLLTPHRAAVTKAVSVSSDDEHSCVVDTGATLRCWGKNSNGELGDGTTANRSTPVVSGQSVASVAVGVMSMCVVTTTQTVSCAGDGAYGELGTGSTQDAHRLTAVPGLTGISQVAVGYRHACALKSPYVYCWGDNSDGQVGDGTTTTRLSPVLVNGLVTALASGESVTQIAAGWNHTCARTNLGRAFCWGDNTYGQLGDGTTVTKPSPVQVTGGNNIVQISAGLDASCAVLSDSSVDCWGADTAGQLGNGSTTGYPTPQAVSGVSGAQQVSVGTEHACAVLSDGSARCWGGNAFGQVGDGSTHNRTSAVGVYEVSGVVTLAAGGLHTCAIVTGGAVTCWGSDRSGQLGDG